MPRVTHPLGPIALGVASHVLAGMMPFLVATAIGRIGLVPATAWMYAIGALGLIIALTAGRWRRTFLHESLAVWRSEHRRRVVVGLIGFLIAGVSYYFGLSRSARVAEYVFLTRLDWLFQAAVAILLLREPWTRSGLLGGAIAMTGGLLLIGAGALGISGVTGALVYILASLAGYGSFTPITVARGKPGAATLMVWRHWVTTLGFAAWLGLQRPEAMPDGVSLLLCAGGATGIVTLFLLRFVALTALPLWVLSVQAPVQAMVAVGMTFALGGTLPATTYVALALIVAGEGLVAAGEARRAASLQPA